MLKSPQTEIIIDVHQKWILIDIDFPSSNGWYGRNVDHIDEGVKQSCYYEMAIKMNISNFKKEKKQQTICNCN